MCWPLGKGLPSADGPRHGLELVAQVGGAGELVGDRPDLVHLRASPRRRCRRTRGSCSRAPRCARACRAPGRSWRGVELPRHRVRGDVVLAEGRRRVGVGRPASRRRGAAGCRRPAWSSPSGTPRPGRRSRRAALPLYCAVSAPVLDRLVRRQARRSATATRTQTATIASPRRRSAAFCCARICSTTFCRSCGRSWTTWPWRALFCFRGTGPGGVRRVYGVRRRCSRTHGRRLDPRPPSRGRTPPPRPPSRARGSRRTRPTSPSSRARPSPPVSGRGSRPARRPSTGAPNARAVVRGRRQRREHGLAGAEPEQVRALGPEQRGGARAVVAGGQHQVAAAADHRERAAGRACPRPARRPRRARRRPPARSRASSLP